MPHKTIINILLCAAIILAINMATFELRLFGAVTQQADKPVEQVQRNIQVLNGMPSSQLLPVMHLMRTSLGVRCDYCHVAEEGKYWMDDKPAKQTARRMLQMVFEINKANFGGQSIVSCNTCHRGHTRPKAVPMIGQGAFTNTTASEAGANRGDSLPTVEFVLARYVQALGGTAAVSRINTRITKTTLLRPKLINAGTPKAAILNRGETWTIETFQKSPDKYLAIINTPQGVIYQGFNGTIGWMKTAGGQREMSSSELLRIKSQADLYKDLKLRERYSKMTISGKETIEDHEANVVEAVSFDNKSEKLFFDTQSGLLLRRTVYTQTKLGLDPEQTDYEDYREVDGAWLPFIVRVSYLDDNHYGTTRKLTDVKQNVPIDDVKFDMPRQPQ